MVPTYFAKAGPDGRVTALCPVLAGKAVVITERKAKRSTQQNARYFGLLASAAPELGYDSVEELHEGLAMALLPLPPIVPGIPRRRRTPKLNTKEFSLYTDAAERMLRDMGCDLSEWDRQTAIMEGLD